LQAQAAVPDFSVDYSPHHVALLRPDVKNAFPFAGNRISRRAEVEQDFAVFERDGLARVGQKLLQQISQAFSGNGNRLQGDSPD